MCSPVQMLFSPLNRKQPINLLRFRIVIFLVPRNPVIWTVRLNATKIMFRQFQRTLNSKQIRLQYYRGWRFVTTDILIKFNHQALCIVLLKSGRPTTQDPLSLPQQLFK